MAVVLPADVAQALGGDPEAIKAWMAANALGAGPIPNPRSSNHSPLPLAAPAPAPQAPADMLGLTVPTAPMPGTPTYSQAVQASPCEFGLCDQGNITGGGSFMGPGVYAPARLPTDAPLSPEAAGWYARAAEKTFGGRAVSVPAAMQERSAAAMLGMAQDPAFSQRVADLSPYFGLPAAAAITRGEMAKATGALGDYTATPAFGADARLLDASLANAKARAAAAGVYDQLQPWTQVVPNAQDLIPAMVPGTGQAGVGIYDPATDTVHVVPSRDVLRASVATPQSMQRVDAAAQKMAGTAANDAAKLDATLRNRLAAIRERAALLRAQKARDAAAAQVRDAAAAAARAQLQADRLKARQKPVDNTTPTEKI